MFGRNRGILGPLFRHFIFRRESCTPHMHFMLCASLLPLFLSWCYGYHGNEVTCGTVLKLVNSQYKVKLHSHDVMYGSGSGQQSVTGVEDELDSNSYWQIMERNGAPQCIRGRVVKCGQKIRLMHLNTRKNLHSHHFQSPLSSNYEVSAFGEDGSGDEGDDWQVLCDSTHWLRSTAVRLKHMSTEGFLRVSGERYKRPISGQYEVCVSATSSPASYWTVAEGVYIQRTDSAASRNRVPTCATAECFLKYLSTFSFVNFLSVTSFLHVLQLYECPDRRVPHPCVILTAVIECPVITFPIFNFQASGSGVFCAFTVEDLFTPLNG
ncbi:unnamed protein product [Dicrocoelium dendriticum]|nr:unnamed protein product [Dicrocoelium dendriticum]